MWRLLIALALLAVPGSCADAPTNVSLPELANSYWDTKGIKLPSKALVDAVNRAKLPVMDAFGVKREVVLMSIASEFAFEKMMDIFIASLANITFTRKDGSQDNLAKHLVISVMTVGTMDKCVAVAGKYGSFCVSSANEKFSKGNFNTFSADFHGIGFTKTATILDGLTLGVTVLFLDADQVFFKNPLPYLLTRKADVMVSGDCRNIDDLTPSERLPPINNNIGFVFIRPTAMATRAVYNWALWLANLANNGQKPWDQATFAPAMEWVAVDVGVRHLSVAMLYPQLFAYLCMGHCGCDLRGVPLGTNGKYEMQKPCDPELMRGWFSYHMPCAGDMNHKSMLMQEYSNMYVKGVGAINSQSERLEAL